jgi:hypothetical protein
VAWPLAPGWTTRSASRIRPPRISTRKASAARYLHARPDAGDRALDALAAFRGASRQADAAVHVEGPGNVDVAELRRAMATFKEMVDSLSNQHGDVRANAGGTCSGVW